MGFQSAGRLQIEGLSDFKCVSILDYWPLLS